jgi:hypothetical protein
MTFVQFEPKSMDEEIDTKEKDRDAGKFECEAK